MRALLASPLGFLIGVSLGALGGGGSILAVPALVYGAGQDAKAATTTSLFIVGVTSSIGMVSHRQGTSLLVIAVNSASALSQRVQTTGIEWRVAIPFTVAGLAGVAAGKHLADRLAAGSLARWFVALLVVVAVYTGTRSALAV